VLGFRTLDGIEGLNEIHRIEALVDWIVRVRIYCFCPETLAVVGEAVGCMALPRPHRSPSLADFFSAMLGLTPRWRRRRSWKSPSRHATPPERVRPNNTALRPTTLCNPNATSNN
jgi:hypothetical protein